VAAGSRFPQIKALKEQVTWTAGKFRMRGSGLPSQTSFSSMIDHITKYPQG
jgi:hypothetical protein